LIPLHHTQQENAKLRNEKLLKEVLTIRLVITHEDHSHFLAIVSFGGGSGGGGGGGGGGGVSNKETPTPSFQKCLPSTPY